MVKDRPHVVAPLPPNPHPLVLLSKQAAFKSVDDYVIKQAPYQHQGSTAVAVVIHCDREGKSSIISCNVGDSRYAVVFNKELVSSTLPPVIRSWTNAHLIVPSRRPIGNLGS